MRGTAKLAPCFTAQCYHLAKLIAQVQEEYPANVGRGSYNTCNTPAQFSRATSLLLTVCLYLAYSKLLKLMAATNAGGE